MEIIEAKNRIVPDKCAGLYRLATHKKSWRKQKSEDMKSEGDEDNWKTGDLTVAE